MGTGGGIKFSAQEKNSESYQKALDVLSSDEFTQALRAEGMAAQSVLRQSQVSDQDSLETGLSAALSHQQQASTNHAVALNELQSAEKTLSFAEQVSSSITAQGDDGFINWLMNNKEMTQGQAHQLFIDANQGGPAGPAQQHLFNYAREYEQDQLAEFIENFVTRENLDGGNFNGKTDVFGPIDHEGSQIKSETEGAMKDKFSTGTLDVTNQDANNQSKVKIKAGNLDDIVATNLAANEEKIEVTTNDLVQAIKTFDK
jgi:hypothetical protein